MCWEKEKDELFAFFRKAVWLRRNHEILRRGEYHTIEARKGSFLYIYAREMNHDKILIAMNGNSSVCNLPIVFENGQVLWQEGFSEKKLAPMGFVIVRI